MNINYVILNCILILVTVVNIIVKVRIGTLRFNLNLLFNFVWYMMMVRGLAVGGRLHPKLISCVQIHIFNVFKTEFISKIKLMHNFVQVILASWLISLIPNIFSNVHHMKTDTKCRPAQFKTELIN